jgi:hypothetical protein
LDTRPTLPYIDAVARKWKWGEISAFATRRDLKRWLLAPTTSAASLTTTPSRSLTGIPVQVDARAVGVSGR